MLDKFRRTVAAIIAPEYKEEMTATQAVLEIRAKEADHRVNQRVADILNTMDPFEPILKKYHVIFSEEYPHPEDKLAQKSQYDFFLWAFSLEQDPNYKYLTDWIQNVQGNATVRQAKNSEEWFFGRATLAFITLYRREVSRLANRYKDIIAKRDGSFDAFLPVE